MIFPELRFGAEEAAQDPLAAQERINLETFFGREGLKAREVLVLERGEIVAGFAGDELRFGIEAGLEGVLGRDGLALGCAGASGFLRVEAIGLDLTLRSHRGSLASTVTAGKRRAGERAAGVIAGAGDVFGEVRGMKKRFLRLRRAAAGEEENAPGATSNYSIIACMTAFSKSGLSCRVGVSTWTSRIPMSFSFGSIQKWVPNAPSQP